MTQQLGNEAVVRLQQIIEAVEGLRERKKELSKQEADVFSHAKALGFDTKAIRTVIGLRAKDEQELAEQEQIVNTYRVAAGLALPPGANFAPSTQQHTGQAPAALSPVNRLRGG